MKLALLVTFALTPSLALADSSYNDADRTVSHDCAKEPSVAINASGGTYTFTGACDKITVNGSSVKVSIATVKSLAVNGSENRVDVDAVDKISAMGSSNTIVYRKGIANAKPKTSSFGSENKITQK